MKAKHLAGLFATLLAVACGTQKPASVVIYYSQGYDTQGWAVLFAGGSLPNIPLRAATASPQQLRLLEAIAHMQPTEGDGCLVISDAKSQHLVYIRENNASITVTPGSYDLFTVDAKTGGITLLKRSVRTNGTLSLDGIGLSKIVWVCGKR